MKLTRLLLVWIPQGIAQGLASSMGVALSLLLYELTGSALVLSSTVAISLLASIYLSPFVGGLADHIPRRTLILVGNAVLALLAIGLAAVMRGPSRDLIVPFTILLVSGAISAIVVVSQQAIMRDIVKDDQLVQANAIVALIQSAPMVVGPAIGTWLYAVGGFRLAALLNAAGLLFAAVSALALPSVPVGRRSTSWIRLPFAGAGEGMRLLWQSPEMRTSQLCYSVANAGNGLSGGILSAAILAHAIEPRDALGASGSSAALGSLTCALLIALLGLRGRRWKLVLLALACAALFGRLPFALPFMLPVVCVAVVSFLRSVFLEVSNAPLLAIWQSATPREAQGRIFGARRLLAQGPYPLFAWLGGFLSSTLPTWTIAGRYSLDGLHVVIAASCLIELGAVVILWRSNALERLDEIGTVGRVAE